MGTERKLTRISEKGPNKIDRTKLCDSIAVNRIDLTWKLKEIN